MTHSQQLKNLLENEIIQDLEQTIDEVFQMVEKEKTISLADREELEEMQEMHAECKDILEEIALGEMSEEEAEDILSELLEAKTEK